MPGSSVCRSLYLFKDEINVVVHRDILVVEPDGDVGLLPAAIVALAEQSAGVFAGAVIFFLAATRDRRPAMPTAKPHGFWRVCRWRRP